MISRSQPSRTRVSSKNRFVSIDIDEELGRQGATFELADGTHGELPADYVLYYCDPTYDWSPANQLKRTLRDKLDASKLSVRVLADLAGYRVTFTLKRKPAAQAANRRLSGHKRTIR